MNDEQFKQHLEELVQSRIQEVMSNLSISVSGVESCERAGYCGVRVALYYNGVEISSDSVSL